MQSTYNNKLPIVQALNQQGLPGTGSTMYFSKGIMHK